MTMALWVGCTGDAIVSNKYSKFYASFSYNPVSAVSQLYSACNSMGEWVIIRAVNSQFVFSNLTGETVVNRTAVQNYSGYYMGLCGFIVGVPTIPELGATSPVITCYDLACSNCYHDRSVTKRLVLRSGGKAFCSTCQRTYDLNNIGQILQGDGGINLYRYRVYYGNNTISINNR